MNPSWITVVGIVGGSIYFWIATKGMTPWLRLAIIALFVALTILLPQLGRRLQR